MSTKKSESQSVQAPKVNGNSQVLSIVSDTIDGSSSQKNSSSINPTSICVNLEKKTIVKRSTVLSAPKVNIFLPCII